MFDIDSRVFAGDSNNGYKFAWQLAGVVDSAESFDERGYAISGSQEKFMLSHNEILCPSADSCSF